jgi:hypothetical protein
MKITTSNVSNDSGDGDLIIRKFADKFFGKIQPEVLYRHENDIAIYHKGWKGSFCEFQPVQELKIIDSRVLPNGNEEFIIAQNLSVHGSRDGKKNYRTFESAERERLIVFLKGEHKVIVNGFGDFTYVELFTQFEVVPTSR